VALSLTGRAFVHKTTLNRKQMSHRDFHDSAVNIGNYLMHYTRFEEASST
jgi:hypothetical protein